MKNDYTKLGYDPFLRKPISGSGVIGYDAYSVDNMLEGGISGNKISGGKISSEDGKTYFDLSSKRLVINDGTNDRVLLGFDDGGF